MGTKWTGAEKLEGLCVAIDSLTPDPKNARNHSSENIDALKYSLRKFGQQKPLVTYKSTIYAGNGTYQAAKDLGWEKIAVVECRDRKTAEAYAIADNRTAELSTWNAKNLLAGLGKVDLDKNVVGFTSEYLDDLVNPFKTVLTPIAKLKAHPKNYQKHPKEQIKHLKESIRKNGFYRNVVVARDFTILAGHGVVQAAKELGKKQIPVIKLAIEPDSPEAMRVLTGDNEIHRLAQVDESALTDLLKSLTGMKGVSLLGTGLDPTMLTPPTDPTAHWAGMPEFKQEDKTAYRHIVVNFKSDRDAQEFGKRIGQHITEKTRSIWFPPDEIGRIADKKWEGKKKGKKK